MSVTNLTFSFVWILISEVKSAKCQTRLPPLAGEDDVFFGGIEEVSDDTSGRGTDG